MTDSSEAEGVRYADFRRSRCKKNDSVEIGCRCRWHGLRACCSRHGGDARKGPVCGERRTVGGSRVPKLETMTVTAISRQEEAISPSCPWRIRIEAAPIPPNKIRRRFATELRLRFIIRERCISSIKTDESNENDCFDVRSGMFCRFVLSCPTEYEVSENHGK